MLEAATATTPLRRRPRVVPALLAASLLLNLALGAVEVRRAIRKGGLRYIREQIGLAAPVPPTSVPRYDFQEELERRYRALPASAGGVVFAGDSLVHAGPWAEVFGTIRNRGIGGETTAGLLGRLDEIIARHPDALFLLVGTNDLADDDPPGRIVANYRAILGRVATESPATSVYVLSVLPVDQARPRGPLHDNASVLVLNERLRTLVGEFPAARYLDVHGALAGPDGRLRDEYTTDGLHLSPEGYLRLCREIESIVRPHVGPEAEMGRVERRPR